jgi:uncharacterized protein
VLLYAAQYDDVPNVVNIAGRFDMTRGIRERFGNDIVDRVARDKAVTLTSTRDDGVKFEWTLTKWSLQDRLELNMKDVSQKIKVSEVLTVHGTNDKAIPVQDAYEFDKFIANHKLQVLQGADHNFLRPEHAEQMIELVVHHCTL